MRVSQAPSTLLSLLFIALSNIDNAQAWPLLGELDFSFLQGRETCASYCGADSQFCCTAGQACTTNQQNVAACVAATSVAVATGANGIPIYTTTWTETDLLTKTSTAYSYPATSATTVAPAAAICTTSLGQTSCGTLCCASGQVCAAANSCSAYASSWTYFQTTSEAASSSYSAPLRPTSAGVSTATSVVSATTTQPFVSPATASGSSLPITSSSSSNGLSPGAIAGIVIGTIAGIILLIVICFCCIVRAGFSGLLALFGLGKSRRRSTERVETVERYSRHGSGTAASRRDAHTGWFGMGGRAKPASSRIISEKNRKKSGGFGGMGAVGAGLIGLAVILGLKRKHDKKSSQSHHHSSDVSSESYTETSFTGTSATQVQTTEEREIQGTVDPPGAGASCVHFDIKLI
ncbi:hypothetical protein LSUB1_G000020 [Lachnellula subtilissima]|uniref:GPI-anchored protein n=1 Tax=Lachnellula subtilissima TaxID=602034 RepID=A0A8H8S1L1_9HELO|nr:hypothetical protein LSUB1_G000020 [Lachnellula subtilissima]